MKKKRPSRLPKIPVAAFAAALVCSLPANAATFTWSGATSGNWQAAGTANWDAPITSDNETDLIFNTTSRTLATSGNGSYIGGSRTVRSISYGSGINAAIATSFNFFNNTPFDLTLSALSGNASINVDGGATGAISLGQAVGVGANPGALVLSSNLDVVHNGSGQLTFNRGVTGTGNLTKTGTGTLAFTGGTVANTYSGLTTVSAGGLTLSKSAATNAIAGNVLVNGTGLLTLGAANQIKDTSNVEIAAGTFAMGANAESVNGVTLSGGAITGSGTLASATAFDLQSGNASAILAGTAGATKSTGGTVVLSGANTLSGSVAVDAGKLQLAGTTATELNTATSINLGGGTLEFLTSAAVNKSLTPNLTISSASTLAYNNTTGTTQTLTIQTGSMVLDAGLKVQNISSNTTLVNGITITRNITGNGGLTVETYNDIASSAADYNLGRVSFSGDNSAWNGDLHIAKGTISMQGSSLTGQQTGNGTLTFGITGDSFGAGLSYFSSAANTTSFQVNNDIVVNTGGFRSIKGGNTDHGLILNGNVMLNGNLNVDHILSSTRSIAFAGNITGAGGLHITRSGGSAASSVTLTGTNDYLGATTIATGARLSIGTGGTSGSVSSNIVNDGTLIFNRSNDSSYNSAITGVGALIKGGSGTLILGGTSNYSGGTSVSNGALLIDGVVTTLITTVSSGARIGGDGLIIGDLVLAFGAQLVFSPTSTFNVNGLVTLDNSFGITSLVNADGTAIDWSLVNMGTYSLIGTTTSTFNNISNFDFGGRVNVGGGKEVYFSNGSLQLIVIPEPSTALLLLCSFGMLAHLRHRSRS